MVTRRRFRSDISEVILSSAAMLHKVGALDKATMLELDVRRPTVPSATEPAHIT